MQRTPELRGNMASGMSNNQRKEGFPDKGIRNPPDRNGHDCRLRANDAMKIFASRQPVLPRYLDYTIGTDMRNRNPTGFHR